jgi:hypothetical protein
MEGLMRPDQEWRELHLRHTTEADAFAKACDTRTQTLQLDIKLRREALNLKHERERKAYWTKRNREERGVVQNTTNPVGSTTQQQASRPSDTPLSTPSKQPVRRTGSASASGQATRKTTNSRTESTTPKQTSYIDLCSSDDDDDEDDDEDVLVEIPKEVYQQNTALKRSSSTDRRSASDQILPVCTTLPASLPFSNLVQKQPAVVIKQELHKTLNKPQCRSSVTSGSVVNQSPQTPKAPAENSGTNSNTKEIPLRASSSVVPGSAGSQAEPIELAESFELAEPIERPVATPVGLKKGKHSDSDISLEDPPLNRTDLVQDLLADTTVASLNVGAATKSPGSVATKKDHGVPEAVIQMLKLKARTDARLKAAMKSVQAEKASRQQQRFFDNYINDLTKRWKKNQKTKATTPSPRAPTPSPRAPTALPSTLKQEKQSAVPSSATTDEATSLAGKLKKPSLPFTSRVSSAKAKSGASTSTPAAMSARDDTRMAHQEASAVSHNSDVSTPIMNRKRGFIDLGDDELSDSSPSEASAAAAHKGSVNALGSPSKKVKTLTPSEAKLEARPQPKPSPSSPAVRKPGATGSAKKTAPTSLIFASTKSKPTTPVKPTTPATPAQNRTSAKAKRPVTPSSKRGASFHPQSEIPKTNDADERSRTDEIIHRASVKRSLRKERSIPGLREQLELAAQMSTPTKSTMTKAHKRADSSFSAAGSGYDASADEGHPGGKVADKSKAAQLRALDKIMGNGSTEDSDSGKFILN